MPTHGGKNTHDDPGDPKDEAKQANELLGTFAVWVIHLQVANEAIHVPVKPRIGPHRHAVPVGQLTDARWQIFWREHLKPELITSTASNFARQNYGNTVIKHAPLPSRQPKRKHKPWLRNWVEWQGNHK